MIAKRILMCGEARQSIENKRENMSQSCHNHRMQRQAKIFMLVIAIAAIFAAGAICPIVAHAQGNQNPPPTQPPASSSSGNSAGESSSNKFPVIPLDSSSGPPPPPSAPAAKEPEKEPAPLPAFNPLVAEKDVEVGTYYMKRGDVDAAIDRFTEATVAYPTYALPWQLMGEAYEKKGELDAAVKAYEKYLRIYPHAPTRKKLEEHITQLQSKLQHDSQKTAAK
jgi:tetratricopeptide (TPR) repeat protein